MCNGTNKDNHTGEALGNASAGEEESLPDDDEEPVTSGVSPLSSEGRSQKSPLSDVPSPRCSPVHTESTQADYQEPPSDREVVDSEELVESHNPSPGIAMVTKDGPLQPRSPEVVLDKGNGQMCNGTSPPSSPRVTRSHKRKRESDSPDGPQTAEPVQDR